MMQIETFERQEIADILGLKYSLLKNWTSGRPLTIKPTIHSPSSPGKQPLYSREDVYRFALARQWSKAGLTFGAVEKILNRLDDSMLRREGRGRLLVAKLNTDSPIVDYYSPNLGARDQQERELRQLLLLGDDIAGVMTFNLHVMLDWVDRKIEVHKGHRANEKKSR
jgi:DNA-binding transcriptional MerR regulator